MFRQADSFSMVYQNQMSIGCIDNRYLMMSTSMKDVLLCDFGPNGSYTEPTMTQWVEKFSVSGLCADGENVILSSDKKIYRFNPGVLDTTKTISEQITPLADYTNMGQAPTVIGDYMFVIHHHKGYSRILKLSEDRTNAATIKINDGMHANLGMAIYDGERYYLPLGYAGIVSFDMANID